MSSSSSPPPPYSHTRTPSMSSWAIVVLMLVMPMMTCVPATASNTIEHCLRMLLNPPPPPPPAKRYHRMLDLGRIVCRDRFRSVGYYMRATGELPSNYMEALCNIYGDDEKKVEGFINSTFIASNSHRLMGGQTCATVRKKQQHAPP